MWYSLSLWLSSIFCAVGRFFQGRVLSRNSLDCYDRTPLHRAVEIGDLKEVKVLLATGARPDVRTSIDHQTALHMAAKEGNVHICRALVEYGANVNAVTPDYRFTPLHFAITFNHLEVVEYLLKCNPNLAIITRKGDGLVSFTIKSSKNPEILNLVRDAYDERISYLK